MNKQRVQRIMQNAGSNICVTEKDGNKVYGKGFMYPMRYYNTMYVEGSGTPPGYESGKRYVLICEPELILNAEEGTTVAVDGKDYVLLHNDTVKVKGEYIYGWCSLREFVE